MESDIHAGTGRGQASRLLTGLALTALMIPTCHPARGDAKTRPAKKDGRAERIEGGSKPIGTPLFRPRALERLDVSADGKVLVSAGGTVAEVWDPVSGRRLRRFEAWSGKISLSADGKRLGLLDLGLLRSDLRVVAVGSGKLLRSWRVDAHRVGRVALDPKGALLAVSMDGGDIQLRELAGREADRVLEGHTGDVECLAFSPRDAHRLASAGPRGELKLWDLRSGRAVDLAIGEETHVPAVGFTPDGELLAAGDSYGFVHVFRTADGQPVKRFLARVPEEPGDIRSIAITDGARRVLVGTWSGVIALWDPAGPKLISVLDEGGLVAGAVAFSPDGETAMGGLNRGAIRFWDAGTGQEREQVAPGNLADTDALAWTADGRRAVVAAGGKRANVWDLETHKLIGRLAGHTRRVEQVAATPDGALIATGGNDGWVRLWDGRSLEQRQAARDHSGGVSALALSADGRRIASGGRAGRLVMRDTQTSEVTFRRDEEEGANAITALALTADASLLVSGDTMGGLEWLDPATGAPLALRDDDYASNVRSIAFSPDGRHLCTAASDRVRVYQTATAALVVTFSAPGWSVTNAAWLPDSRRLVFGDSDGHLWVADPFAGRVLQRAFVEELSIRAVALRADGKRLVTGQRDTTLRLWDLARLPKIRPGQELALRIERRPDAELAKARPLPRSARLQCAQVTPRAGQDALPYCAIARLGATRFQLEGDVDDEAGVLRFSDDGTLLAAGGSERLSVFELPSGRLKHRLPCCMAAPMAARFSPDSKRLAVTPFAGNTQMWDLTRDQRLTTWSYKAVVMAVSPDGKRWAGATREGAILVGDEAGQRTRSLPVQQRLPVQHLAFSPDGRRLAALRAWRVVDVWEVDSSKRTWSTLGSEETLPMQLQDDPALWVGFGERGELVVDTLSQRCTQAEDGTWKLKPLGLSMEDADSFDEASEPCSPGGRACGLRTEDAIRIDQEGRQRRLPIGEAERTALGPGGRLLALTRGEQVILWDVSRAERVSPTPVPPVQAPLDLSTDGTLLTRRAQDLRLWRPGSDAPSKTFAKASRVARLSGDGRQILALVDKRGLVRIDTRSGRTETVDEGPFADLLAPSKDFARVALLRQREESGSTLEVLAVRTGKILLHEPGPESTSFAQLALSPDGSRVALASENLVDLRTVPAGKRIAKIDSEDEVHMLAFTPDGRELIAGSSSHMDIYSTRTGAWIGRMGDHANVQAVAFSGDGRLMVSVGLDELVRVFDTKHRRLRAVLPGHDRWIHSVVVSDSPPRALSLDAGGTIFLWDLSPWAR